MAHALCACILGSRSLRLCLNTVGRSIAAMGDGIPKPLYNCVREKHKNFGPASSKVIEMWYLIVLSKVLQYMSGSYLAYARPFFDPSAPIAGGNKT